MSIHPPQPVTADQLLHTHDLDRCELVHGEVRTMSPAGASHSLVTANLAFLLRLQLPGGDFRVLVGDPGFVLARNPDTVLAPDVALVKSTRLVDAPFSFLDGAPDLAIEVRSPSESRPQIETKARAWLAAGCPIVLNVEPDAATITVWQREQPPIELRRSDVFTHAAFPALSLRVADVFAAP